jgi:hypothetical protein
MGTKLAESGLLTYTSCVQGEYVKRAAWLLLLLLLLDLSTSPICSAGTFAKFNDPSAASLTTGTRVQAQPALNLDDDGCFCCCTHVLPGTHVKVVPPVPLVVSSAILIVGNPFAISQTLFHRPKR